MTRKQSKKSGEMSPDYIVLSPGPGKPKDAGCCIDVVKTFAGEIPILGVCLGHQAICEAFGATVSYAKELMHGKTSLTKIDTKSKNISGYIATGSGCKISFSGGKKKETLPEELHLITAQTEDGEVMAVEHKSYPVYGLQFHPESILTQDGKQMIHNF